MDANWLWGLAGGVMIGTAGAIYLLGNGRIMGASGILGGLLRATDRSDRAERVAFLAGLVIVPFLLSRADPAAATHATSNIFVLVAAGVLVGIGTRLASGCTSGHGVCGISRLSPRGIAATLVYIAAGAVTLGLVRALWGAV